MVYAAMLNGYQPHQHSAHSHSRSKLERQESAQWQPANCWTFDSKGLSEGIRLDLQHPAANGPALIMGEGTWVLVNKFEKLTGVCRPDRAGVHALMRRAQLRTIDRDGHKPFHLFTRLQDKVDYHLVYVNAELPGVTPKIEQLSQIVGNSVMLAGVYEGLYRVTSDNPIFVFYKDGSVVKLVIDDGKLNLINFDRTNALEQRLDYIQCLLGEAAEMESPNAVIRREDWLCHRLLSMLEVLNMMRDVQEREMLQNKVVDVLTELNSEGMLRPAVRGRLTEILANSSDMIRWRFDAGSLTNNSSDKLSPEQVAKRQARLKRRKDNAEARAAENRAHVKGPSPSPDNHYRGKGKKGKNK